MTGLKNVQQFKTYITWIEYRYIINLAVMIFLSPIYQNPAKYLPLNEYLAWENLRRFDRNYIFGLLYTI